MRNNFYNLKRAIVIDTIAGSNISDCCEEAIKLASLLDCVVVFTHNECNMIIRPSENYETVIKRWKCGANSYER